MVLYLLLLLAGTQEISGLDHKCEVNNSSYANGCTMPLDLDIWYTDIFEEACNIHDICYFCGHKYKKSRFDCDVKFLEDMNSVCWRETSAVELPLCLLFSVSFYAIVRAVSENYFIYDNSAHCIAPWVKPCITCYYSKQK